MKIYSCPEELPAPEIDYANYDHKKVQEQEDAHRERLKNWMIQNGYTGARTGQILRVGIGDGYAQYMLAEGSKSFLMHLPYGDAYHSPDVQYLPKKEVLRRIEADKSLASIFSGRS